MKVITDLFGLSKGRYVDNLSSLTVVTKLGISIISNILYLIQGVALQVGRGRKELTLFCLLRVRVRLRGSSIYSEIVGKELM